MHSNQQLTSPDHQTIRQQSIAAALQNLDTMEQRIISMIGRMRADLLALADACRH